MADRLSTPDILGAVMSGETIKEESNKAIKQEIQEEIDQVSNKAVKQPKNKAISKKSESVEEGSSHSEEPKEKVTYNLPVRVLNELEDKWIEMRRLSGSKQVSKTLIVEMALEMAFAEFDMKKEGSKFYCKLVSNKEIKK